MDFGVTFFIALSFAALTGVRAFVPPLVATCLLMADRGPEFGAEPLVSAGVLVLLTLDTVEFFADKIPTIDHMQDVLGTFVRPMMGGLTAVLVMKLSGGSLSLFPALIMGGLAALFVHGLKAGARVVSTATTGGAVNPVLSFLEDMLVAGLVVAAGVVVVA